MYAPYGVTHTLTERNLLLLWSVGRFFGAAVTSYHLHITTTTNFELSLDE